MSIRAQQDRTATSSEPAPQCMEEGCQTPAQSIGNPWCAAHDPFATEPGPEPDPRPQELFQVTIKVSGIRKHQTWTRFAADADEARRSAIAAIDEEWPGRTARIVAIEPTSS